MKAITSRIIGHELVEWKKLKWLQSDDLKEINIDVFEKLKNSLINNNFIQPFNVWKDKKTLWILDGHHRKHAIEELEKEGIKIPAKLPANLIDCKNKKEALKFVLLYSSQYAHTTEEGLRKFLLDNNIFDKNIISEIDLSGFNIDNIFNEENLTDEQLDNIPEIPEISFSKNGDLFVLNGKHRIMCGDSTKKEDVEKLMGGKKADMVFTDPPYGINLDTDFSSMKNKLEFMQSKGIMSGKKYRKVEGDNKDFNTNLIGTIFNNFNYCKEIFLFGADYYAEYLQGKNEGSWIVWDKRLDESADKMYGSCFELCWSKNKHKRWIARVKWAGAFGTEKEPDHKRFHPNQKPINLIKWFFDYYSLINKKYIVDIYLGVGSTLIACEQTDRICYGMEIDPIYIDVILRRYHKLYPQKTIKCLNRKIDFKKLFSKNK
jgi:DNA modification methylase